jgi:propanediol dehydratase small subunit
MEMNSANVEEVVKQVLENMLKSPVAAPAASAPAPGNSKDSTRSYADISGAL